MRMGALTPIIAVANSSVGDVPVGVGIGVNAGAEYLFTANQGGGSVSSFTVTSGTNVITPPVPCRSRRSTYNGPTGLVVDPQNLFVYTADNFDGTVSQSSIKGSCGIQLCEVRRYRPRVRIMPTAVRSGSRSRSDLTC